MSKQEEIKQALAAATSGPWLVENGWNDNPMMVMRPDRKVPIAELAFENYENDANLIAKAPEYIAYLLADNEQLEKRNQDLDAWATEGFEENQKLVLEVVRLRKELEVKNGTIQTLIKKITDEVAISATAMGEIVRICKELEEAHYALNAIQMGEWSCTHDEQGLEVWTTRRINPSQIAREALGQEGEGNQDEKYKGDA